MKNQPARVTNIPVENIDRNPHNPRRLFDEEPMKILMESIKTLGILVPLDVYPKKGNFSDPEKDSFILLDGERRWKCAKELKRHDVPCIVVETPSDVRNILIMFHIHNVRAGWQLMPTAIKIKLLMKMLKTRSENKLAELTKLSVPQIRRCKILLTYQEKFQKMMLAPIKDERFKPDFFIDLHRIRGPALKENFPPWVRRGDTRCIDIMIEKYKKNIIKAVTEFRDMASIYSGSKRVNKVSEFMDELNKFFDDPDMKISDIYVSGATYEKEIKEISRSTKRLFSQLDGCDIEGLSTDEKLISELKRLTRLIESKLEKALLDEPRDRKL